MASKSGGTIPAPQKIIDASQAIALLSTMHFWSCTTINLQGVKGYRVCITHAGKRVNAERAFWINAVIAAFDKLRGEKKSVANAAFMKMAE